jgi:hypothetical protein
MAKKLTHLLKNILSYKLRSYSSNIGVCKVRKYNSTRGQADNPNKQLDKVNLNLQ